MSKGITCLCWLIGILLVLLIAFGIGQPFVWYLLNETPPTTAIMTTNLLTIIVTIMILGTASFGAGIYYILSSRIQQDATKAAERQYLNTLIRLESHISALYGRLYEGLQNILTPDELTAFVNQSVNYGERAFNESKRQDVQIDKDLIIDAQNNYAMALAFQADPGTSKIAATIISGLQTKLKEYPPYESALFKETIGFVIWRLPRKSKDHLKAAKLLKEACSEAQDFQRKKWQRRWKIFPKGKLS